MMREEVSHAVTFIKNSKHVLRNSSQKKWEDCRGYITGMIIWLWKCQPSHEEFLLRRDSLFAKKEWKTIPNSYRTEFSGMLQGAIESVYSIGTHWCHYYNGAYVDVHAFHKQNLDVKDIDISKSGHVWKGTQKIWK
jgi:hypothetical protein